MATRDTPNKNFAWYNDDVRVAILELDTSPASEGTTIERWDSFTGDGDLSGYITAASCSGTTITYTTSVAHNLEYNTTTSVGDWISIAGTTNFNDSHLASNRIIGTPPSSTQFQMTRSSSSADSESGLTTATFTSKFINDGLRITYHSKYEDVTALTDNLKTNVGLDSGLHPALLMYIKAVLLENLGDLQSAQYYRDLFAKTIKKYPLRKSGIRHLSTPRL